LNPTSSMQLFMGPFQVWSRLAWKAGEMAVSSAQVIGQRSTRLMLSGPVPNARDQREFSLMGSEKGEAMLESAQAFGVRALTLNQQLVTLAFKQFMTASVTLMSIAASRSAAESVERQGKLVRDTMAGSVAAASKLSGSTARIAGSAMRPVQKRVSANARRLRKR